jgi:hypothetical protein
MTMKKRKPYPPKAVELRLDEKIPRRPAPRRSRPVRGAPAAAARLVVEELLCRHHGASDAEFRELGPVARKVLFRIVTDPADRDFVYRRDAVSALAALGSHDGVMVLAALVADEREDAVIVGRALNGLAKVGGDAAVGLIGRALETHPDQYVRDCALKALMKLEHPASVPALRGAAETHRSSILRARVRNVLAAMGAPMKGARSARTRNTGIIVPEDGA